MESCNRLTNYTRFRQHKILAKPGHFALLALLLAACTPPPRQPTAPPADPPKILSFYARDPVVTEGTATVLCFGVENATSVHIDPPVEGVSPSMSRCVEAHPKGETQYTLTATGSSGQSVSQSLTLRTAADQSTLPQITSFQVAKHEKDYAGQTIYTLSFAAQNAEEISIDPPVFPTLHRSPSGQFAVKPEKTTTYTLSAKGKSGHTAQRQLTIEITGR
jgi:hypothetical protein